MKYSHALISLVLILISHGLQGQVQGRILDKKNGEPIPFAHVYLHSAGAGTASNFNGYFRLVVTDKPDTLRVTCIGYEPFVLAINQGSNVPSVIRLAPSTIILDEVVVNGSGPDAGEIMRKAIKRYTINFGLDDYNLKTFMRTTMKCEGKYIHLMESDGWVYDGGAPAWKADETMKYVDWTQFTVQNDVRLSDMKYGLRKKWYSPAGLISRMLIWQPDYYEYSIESIQSVGKDDAFYTIRAKAANKFQLKKKTWGYSRGRTWYRQRFNLMDRVFVIRAKDYAVLEVRMAERYSKKKDGIRTRGSYPNGTKYTDSVHYMIKYDITPSGVYRPYYSHRYYEYTDTGLKDHSISPLQFTEKYEMFFSGYDRSHLSIDDLKKRYHSYKPYVRTETLVKRANSDGSTSTVTRPILSGMPSWFQLNHGYVVWGKPSYHAEYWKEREKTIPPYENREKLFTDLAKLRPVAEQFADFTPRSEETFKRMLELYGDDPYIREVMDRRIATMKSRYQQLFDSNVDY